ncbi:MAG: RAMP superfamily CRISPR-associated protein [Saprospiraceae bacterium]|nr:RAMP superfamily CRISPR-associated protein [Saprospiraceae bacterium]
MKNTIKYFARFIVETATPLAIGSGEKGLEVDRLIIRDANGLPYIPGSSLAGVIRHEIEKNPAFSSSEENHLFGYQGKEEGQGSRINFSPAKLMDADGVTVIEGLQIINFSEEYYSWFKKLPERDHVRITDKGVAKDKGKFDEELLHRGTKFAFEIDLEGTEDDLKIWNSILKAIHQPFFRIGAGTRNGFGKLKILECRIAEFDLTKQDELKGYLAKSTSLNSDTSSWKRFSLDDSEKGGSDWQHYQVDLTPENFFLFGAGFGDEDADMIQKTERFIDWSEGTPKMGEKQTRTLISATSIKGAISHRVAYHYNLAMEKTISNPYEVQKDILPKVNLEESVDNFSYGVNIGEITLSSDSDEWEKLNEEIDSLTFENFKSNSNEWKDFIQSSDELCSRKVNKALPLSPTGENNNAVKALFGYAKEDEDKTSGARGNVIISDVYLDYSKSKEKVFSHVAIDRFTGGGINGALYQEKVVNSNSFQLDIYVLKTALEDIKIKDAFESTLSDLVSGNLQLGGNTTKGHGAFTGNFQTS